MPARTAEATWHGNLQEGSGSVKLGSGAYDGPFSFKSRFEDGTGTNPEELIGAAEAGCFTMALSARLSRSGFDVESVHTTAQVHLEKVGDNFSITRIHLINESNIMGIEDAAFQEHAAETKKSCIVSRALTGVEITLEAKLIS
ncbi:MAG: OsmC family protein [Chloroflexota bacterium]|nr:OsmC family protein [Chloroflexota bacterium]